jgi:pyruvate/2-oxoglutarate dehydrogenase complex dihydrolipoamide acyltransferase (E2) component
VIGPFPRQRRHTLHFLSALAGRAPVHLGGEADVTGAAGGPSITARVIAATAAALARRTEANSAYHRFPRAALASADSVDVKVAFDVEVAGVRTVQSAVLPRAEGLSAAEIHEWLRRTGKELRDEGPARTAIFGKLPIWLGRAGFRVATSAVARRKIMGTVSVTSLAHRRVGWFFSDGGTTITIGVGRPVEKPAVVGGAIAVRTLAPISLTFDHRAVDGALAADVLTDVIGNLEETSACMS